MITSFAAPDGGPAAPAADEHAEAASSEASRASLLDEILHTPVAEPEPGASLHAAVEGLRTARLTGVSGRRATISLRGQRDPVAAEIASEVDPAVVSEAVETGDSVLVEFTRGKCPLIVGVLHTRRPREIRLKAATVHIQGEEEVLIRSGLGALRVRADGEVEIVGSRISAVSRGMFRLMGRILRLN